MFCHSQVQVLKWERVVDMKKCVWPPDEFHTRGQSWVAWAIFIYISKASVFSPPSKINLQKKANKLLLNFYIKTALKAKTMFDILLAWQISSQACPVLIKLKGAKHMYTFLRRIILFKTYQSIVAEIGVICNKLHAYS